MTPKEFEHNTALLRLRLVRQAYSLLKDTDEAEDAVQESLLKLWQMRDRIPDFLKMEHLAMVVVRNSSISLLRKKSRSTSVSLSDREGRYDIASASNAHQRIEEQETEEWLRHCILSLPDKQRAIIHMRNVEHMGYAEIARIIGSTESSVRGMTSRARNDLLKKLKERNK